MGDFGTSDCSWTNIEVRIIPMSVWTKLTIAKSDDDEWVSSVKTEQTEEINDVGHTTGFSLSGEHDPFSGFIGTQICVLNCQNKHSASYPMLSDPRILLEAQVNPRAATPRRRKRSESASSIKKETDEKRAARLAKMAVYAAQRFAKETPEQRAARLKRMSEYAAKRLREETPEQRAKRLARMAANKAKRLAKESPEQKQERLKRTSAYVAKRHAQKKGSNAMDLWSENKEFNNDAKYPEFYVIMPDQS